MSSSKTAQSDAPVQRQLRKLLAPRTGRYTFITPFTVLFCLTAPSLVVLVLTRHSAGFAALEGMGYLLLIKALLWLLIPATIVFGVLHIIYGRLLFSRVMVVLLAVALVTAFMRVN